MTVTMPAAGNSSMDSSDVTAMPLVASCSANRSAEPWPSAVRTTTQPATAHSRSWSRALSAAPRYASVWTKPVSITTSSLISVSRASDETSAQRTPRIAAEAWTSSRSAYEDPDKSMGVALPTAALCHEAARNSSAVRTRSNARERIRSGSHTTTVVRCGTRSIRPSMCSTSTGVSASMPSFALPSASADAISATSGIESAKSWARRRTSGVSKSSRTGGAIKPAGASSSDR